MDVVGEARSSNESHWSCEKDVVGERSPTVRANRIRVGRSPFSCRGHLTRTEGRDGTQTPGEGRMIR